MCQRVQKSLRAGGEVRQVEVERQLEAQAFGDAAGDVGVAREVAVDLEREGVDRQQGQAAVEGLPAPEEVVDDQRQVVGDDDLLEQAPEDQVRSPRRTDAGRTAAAWRPAAAATSAA